MELTNLTVDELMLRKTELRSAMDVEDANLDEIEAEARAINAELESRKAIEAEKAEARDAVANGDGEVVAEQNNEIIMEERKTMTFDSMEYRDAFYSYLSNPTTEARNALINVDGNGSTITGDAVALPKGLDTKIWDNIHTAHPILADITTINSGIVMEVTRHTAIATRVSGKKDAGTTAGAEDNTFVKVTLAGADYEKYVELTYAEAKMSQGALEDYIATEIAAELGEALAKDVFARIKSDATTTQKVTDTSTPFADIMGALALASGANNAVVYANNADYYAILGATDDNGQPIFRNGVVLGAQLKKDNAAVDVTVVDPTMFVLNQVQGVMIESDKDVKSHHVIVSGYLRAEGCLRNVKAAAYIA